MKARAKLNLRVLGGFEARVDPGSVLVLPTKKTQALLTYLALPPGRSHPRDKLASLLWGDMPDAQALGNLRQALARIRRVLPQSMLRALVLDGKTVALDSSLVEVDAARFEQLVADGKPDSLEGAAILYQGDLLAGLTLDERSFEDWLTSQRERLHELALAALARLLAHQQDVGLSEAAIQTGLRLLALDPLQEAIHRAVMRLYSELGRRAAALSQYQRCVSILRREMAADPELDTQQLYQKILREPPARREAPLRARSTDPAPGADSHSILIQQVGDTPLIGREEELRRLQASLDAALGGRSLLVAVLGEAGIGKTRLLAELASLAAQRGIAILVGHAYESEQILPYGPWIDAFRSSRRVRDTAILDKLDPGVRAEVVRLVPALGDRSAAVATSSEPSQVFSAVAELIGELGSRQPLLVILEDIQWADEMTLRLVPFLTRSLPPRPILIAVSARAEALAETPMLNRILDELSVDKRLMRLDLEPLSEPATLTLANLVASGRGTRQALATVGQEIWRVSEGNPFVVVETLQALERGAVPEAAPLSVPARVRALVTARLERLSESERHLVSVAAVIGRRFTFRLLSQAVGQDEEEIASVVEKLVRHRVLHGVDESFDFMHDRIRTVVYDLLLPPRRALLHRRVASALEVVAEHDAPSQHLVLGTHYRLGEVWDRALTHLSVAARMAAARGAHQESVTCYDRALEVLERLPTSDELRARATDLLIDLGNALHNNLGEFQRASAVYRRAEPLATALGDETRLVRIWSGQAYTEVSTGKHRAALSTGERALEGAERLRDLDLEIWARASLVRTHDALGNYERAADICQATIPILQQRPRGYLFGPTFVLLHAYVRGWLAIPLAFLGEFDEARQVALEAVEIADQEGHDQDRAWAYSCLGRVHQERGEPEEAIRWFERTIDLSRDVDRGFYRIFAGFLGLAYAQAGRIDEAVATTEAGMARIETMQYFRARPKYFEMEGIVRLAAGRPDEAERSAIAALAIAQEQGERGHEGWAFRLLGDLACHRTPPDLDRAAAHYREADAIARELGMRPLQARCHLALAEVYANTGKSDAARAELAAADALFASMTMTSWRRRVNALEVRLRS